MVLLRTLGVQWRVAQAEGLRGPVGEHDIGAVRREDGDAVSPPEALGHEQLRDLVISVGIEAVECLERVEYLARQCRHYGIEAELKVTRAASGDLEDRHYVVCHSDDRSDWVMHLVLAPLDHGRTHVVLGIAQYRRQGTGIASGRAAVAFRKLVEAGLLATRPRSQGNIVALRAYAELSRPA